MPIFEARMRHGYRKGLQPYTSIIGARACFAHTFGVVVEGAQELIFPVPSSCDSTLKRTSKKLRPELRKGMSERILRKVHLPAVNYWLS